jgi:hypothetical protein
MDNKQIQEISDFFNNSEDPKPTVYDISVKFNVPIVDVYKILKEIDGRIKKRN